MCDSRIIIVEALHCGKEKMMNKQTQKIMHKTRTVDWNQPLIRELSKASERSTTSLKMTVIRLVEGLEK